MWIVRIALQRPYTFIVLALLILIVSPVSDPAHADRYFPQHQYPGNLRDLELHRPQSRGPRGRLTTVYERVLTTTVDNIQHIESTTVNGGVVKIFLQPGASLDTANAQVTAVSQTILRQLPPGALPRWSSISALRACLIFSWGFPARASRKQQLNDLGLNFLRHAAGDRARRRHPVSLRRKQRQVMIDLNPSLLQAKGLSPPMWSTR